MVRIEGRGPQQPNNVNQTQGKNQVGQNILTGKVSELANKVKATALSTITSINQLPYSKTFPKSIAKEVGDVAREAFKITAQTFTNKNTKKPR